MSNTFYTYTFAGLLALVGLGAGHSTMPASDVGPMGEDGSSAAKPDAEPAAKPEAEPDAEPACSNAGDSDELGGATTSDMSSPYYCICCEFSGKPSCCSMC